MVLGRMTRPVLSQDSQVRNKFSGTVRSVPKIIYETL
jgi:hypothetical protein